jgi:murein DD-endopeptidase MepM/ murein hydrolase activator NlpD
MRARPTIIGLVLTATATAALVAPVAASAAKPDPPAHGQFAGATSAAEPQIQLVARLRHTERARLSAVAQALITPPPPAPTEPEPAPAPAPAEPAPAPAADSGRDGFIWPTHGPIGSPFGPRGGRRHDGIDILARTGTPIVAPQSGTVIFTGWKNGYGNTVVVDHGGGISTLYGHQSRIIAHNGQHLEQGELIGLVGSTGRVTAPHLHYEVHINGTPRNPKPWLS